MLKPLGGGRFDAIDSNQNWDEIVRLRPNYDPAAVAARYWGISVHVYRFPGGPAIDAPPPVATQLAAGTAVVSADGDCLRLGNTPGLSGVRLDCISHGSTVSVIGPAQVLDGLAWIPVDSHLGSGWVAAIYLAEAPATPATTSVTTKPITDAPVSGGTSADANPIPSVSVEADGYVLPVPPQGGLTRGPTGTTDPAAFAVAQAFPMLDARCSMQGYLTFIPSIPAHVNTLNVAPSLRTQS